MLTKLIQISAFCILLIENLSPVLGNQNQVEFFVEPKIILQTNPDLRVIMNKVEENAFKNFSEILDEKIKSTKPERKIKLPKISRNRPKPFLNRNGVLKFTNEINDKKYPYFPVKSSQEGSQNVYKNGLKSGSENKKKGSNRIPVSTWITKATGSFDYITRKPTVFNSGEIKSVSRKPVVLNKKTTTKPTFKPENIYTRIPYKPVYNSNSPYQAIYRPGSPYKPVFELRPDLESFEQSGIWAPELPKKPDFITTAPPNIVETVLQPSTTNSGSGDTYKPTFKPVVVPGFKPTGVPEHESSGVSDFKPTGFPETGLDSGQIATKPTQSTASTTGAPAFQTGNNDDLETGSSNAVTTTEKVVFNPIDELNKLSQNSAVNLVVVLGLPVMTAMLSFIGAGPLAIALFAWLIPLFAILILPDFRRSS